MNYAVTIAQDISLGLVIGSLLTKGYLFFLEYRNNLLHTSRPTLTRKIKDLLRIDKLISAESTGDIVSADFQWAINRKGDSVPLRANIVVRNPRNSSSLETHIIKGPSFLFDMAHEIYQHQHENTRPSTHVLLYVERMHSINRMKVRFWHLMRRLGLRKPGASFQRTLDALPIHYGELICSKKQADLYRQQMARWREREHRALEEHVAQVEARIATLPMRQEEPNTRIIQGAFTMDRLEDYTKPRGKRRMPGSWDNNLVLNARVDDIKVMEQAKVDEQTSQQDMMNRMYSNPPVSGSYNQFRQSYPFPEPAPLRVNTPIAPDLLVEVNLDNGRILSISHRMVGAPNLVIYRNQEARVAHVMVYTGAEIESVDVRQESISVRAFGSIEAQPLDRGTRSYTVRLRNGEVFTT